jgi:hypothetical protein
MVTICIKDEQTHEMSFLVAPDEKVAKRVCVRSLNELKKEGESIIYDMASGIFTTSTLMAFFTEATMVVA